MVAMTREDQACLGIDQGRVGITWMTMDDWDDQGLLGMDGITRDDWDDQG